MDDAVQRLEDFCEVPNGFSYTARAPLASPWWPSALVSSVKATGGTAR